MKKFRIAFGFIAALCVLLLSSCGHSHSWQNADCTTPKTCAECGETDGEPLGHTWKEATCTTPKTCTVCGKTEGDAIGHTWEEATCDTPKTCGMCGKTEGEALGHSWEDATCENPKKCSVCGAIGEKPLGHDTPQLTCTEGAICNRCGKNIEAPGHELTKATCVEPATCKVCGEISGEALGHTTKSGVCTRCGLEVYETVTGNGDDVVSDISVGDGIYRVHFIHSGRRNFVVRSYDANNERDLLVNEIGNYDGYVLLYGDQPYSFEVTADGKWSYTIERLDKTSDTSFAGKGDYVTGICSLTSGAYRFVHDGDSNFAVKIYTTEGRDLLVNEIGSYDGKKMITIPAGSYAFFTITADGNWSIERS